jgi:cytochrome b subunit of formate dehydrogenase
MKRLGTTARPDRLSLGELLLFAMAATALFVFISLSGWLLLVAWLVVLVRCRSWARVRMALLATAIYILLLISVVAPGGVSVVHRAG